MSRSRFFFKSFSHYWNTFRTLDWKSLPVFQLSHLVHLQRNRMSVPSFRISPFPTYNCWEGGAFPTLANSFCIKCFHIYPFPHHTCPRIWNKSLPSPKADTHTAQDDDILGIWSFSYIGFVSWHNRGKPIIICLLVIRKNKSRRQKQKSPAIFEISSLIVRIVFKVSNKSNKFGVILE